MKQVRVMQVLAIVLLAAACGEESGPSESAASVRFFNAMTDMAGNGAFLTNGQFAAGSALAFGQSSQACSTVEAGATSFGFGAANEGGTGLSGGALETLSDQSLTAADNVTVVAAGSAASPELFLLSNNFSDALASNQAAVRFVNLAPGTGETANLFNVLTGTIGSGPTDVFEIGLEVGEASAFKTVASGSSPYSILIGHSVAIAESGSTLDLQPGSVNTVAIVPDPASGSFQLINIPRCPA
jgi:hypothetical protein